MSESSLDEATVGVRARQRSSSERRRSERPPTRVARFLRGSRRDPPRAGTRPSTATVSHPPLEASQTRPATTRPRARAPSTSGSRGSRRQTRNPQWPSSEQRSDTTSSPARAKYAMRGGASEVEGVVDLHRVFDGPASSQHEARRRGRRRTHGRQIRSCGAERRASRRRPGDGRPSGTEAPDPTAFPGVEALGEAGDRFEAPPRVRRPTRQGPGRAPLRPPQSQLRPLRPQPQSSRPRRSETPGALRGSSRRKSTSPAAYSRCSS